MPYIPYQYETVFNAAYDELLLAKQEASFDGVTQKVFNEEDIENILTKKDTNEDLLYMAIEQMEGMNIRRMIVLLHVIFESFHYNPLVSQSSQNHHQ